MDLGTTQVRCWGRRNNRALQAPGGLGGVRSGQTEQVLLALAALHGNMDVVVPRGIVRSRTAGDTGQIGCFDADQHEPIMPSGMPTGQYPLDHALRARTTVIGTATVTALGPLSAHSVRTENQYIITTFPTPEPTQNGT